MNSWKICIAVACLTLVAASVSAAPIVIDFEDVSLGGQGYAYGGPGTAADYVPQTVLLSSGSASFQTTITRYSPDEFWSGFAFSNRGDTTNNSWTNQYSSFTGGGSGGGGNFAVAYWQSYDPPPVINLPVGTRPVSLRLTNTTYTALTMRDGDPNNFAPGEYAADDYLSVTFTGYALAGGGGATTGQATFFLADFRGGNSLIVDTWTDFSLAALGDAQSIGIGFASSDVVSYDGGETYFINTPTYVAIDDLTITPVPEPSAVVLAACGVVAVLVRRWKRGA